MLVKHRSRSATSLIRSPPLLASARALLASIYDDAPTATSLAASLLLSTLRARSPERDTDATIGLLAHISTKLEPEAETAH
ncbi:hypothetical protein B0H13DRAFT_2365285 [Mycena leptocephala]|nr:hypothetical protein B0H13DRAFT_2365285 [Mycena leptocephala]